MPSRLRNHYQPRLRPGLAVLFGGHLMVARKRLLKPMSETKVNHPSRRTILKVFLKVRESLAGSISPQCGAHQFRRRIEGFMSHILVAA